MSYIFVRQHNTDTCTSTLCNEVRLIALHLEITMSIEKYEGKTIRSICSFLPEGKLENEYWLTVYVHSEPDLTKVSQALKVAMINEIDEDTDRVTHNNLHSGESYAEEAAYLNEHRLDIHKHYDLGKESNFPAAVEALTTLII
jgi:hypothetical protein